MLLTTTVIARLDGRSTKWAQRQVAAGHFGPVMHRCRLWQYVDLAAVEKRLGRKFSVEQITAAQRRMNGQERR
jgi:hypothetical protein